MYWVSVVHLFIFRHKVFESETKQVRRIFQYLLWT